VYVTWNATDSGSGVDTSTCLLEVREDEGAWQTFSTECEGEDATYDGQPGYTYTFRLSASDNVSNAASLEVEAVVPYVTKYYYANGQRVAMQKEGVVYYLHTDHLGSTSLTTCGSQDGCDGTPHQGVVARQLYHPYGEVRWSEGTLPTDYTFTGQRNEAGLGLMHYGARFYSPRLGRFVSADTIVPNPLSPQDLNRYTYTRNNPLAYIDRDGHQVLPVIIGLVVVGFIAYDYLAHPDIAYAPGPDVDASALPPSDLPDNDAAICAPCPYVERGQWSTAFVMGAIEFTPLDEVPGVNAALRKVLKEGGEEAAEELAERGARAGGEALQGATTHAVKPYEVGRVDDLLNRSVPGDGLDIHHFPQKHPAGQVVPGYDPDIGPGMAVPGSRHRKMPTLQGNYPGTARDLVARGLQNLRKYTDAPNSALQKLSSVFRELYPGALDK